MNYDLSTIVAHHCTFHHWRDARVVTVPHLSSGQCSRSVRSRGHAAPLMRFRGGFLHRNKRTRTCKSDEVVIARSCSFDGCVEASKHPTCQVGGSCLQGRLRWVSRPILEDGSCCEGLGLSRVAARFLFLMPAGQHRYHTRRQKRTHQSYRWHARERPVVARVAAGLRWRPNSEAPTVHSIFEPSSELGEPGSRGKAWQSPKAGPAWLKVTCHL